MNAGLCSAGLIRGTVSAGDNLEAGRHIVLYSQKLWRGSRSVVCGIRNLWQIHDMLTKKGSRFRVRNAAVPVHERNACYFRDNELVPGMAGAGM